MKRILFAALVCALGVLALPGCRQRTDELNQRPVDPALVAFLGRARAAHHRADLLEDKLELEPALAELRKVTEGPMVDRAADFAEIREVLADTRARMADLESRLGRYDAADRDIAQGLELATEVTYFRGHLFEVRGLVEERRSHALGQRARALLETADPNVPKGSPEAQRRDELLRKLAPSRDASAPKPQEEEERSLQAAQQELDGIHRAALKPEEQRVLDDFRASEQAARQRALEAFEQSMTLQAEVIRARTEPAHDR
jgi:hypothetical protein